LASEKIKIFSKSGAARDGPQVVTQIKLDKRLATSNERQIVACPLKEPLDAGISSKRRLSPVRRRIE